jgi:proteasome lid subunit RPN8/RPN11
VDDEIQFGEVEEASPQASLRPDRNKHFAVVEYGSPVDRDLPIFVDLDVLADMEEHALSDTSVELGGVLLGGTYTDEAGRPFIVVTDSLRAQHYESTKGSFTFTHDTWSAITREREEFPGELAMVGWYHTHPDWGVFLSGMDMFICDNFFNKTLDLAYVIDPCRGDRGMFQWTGSPQQRVRRTGGFFVTASRFRAAELEHYIAELSGSMPATSTRASTGSYGGAPVVHLHQPPPQPPPAWQAPAVVGMLCLQFCLLALIAWKMVDPWIGSIASGGAESELTELKAAVAAKAEAEAALEKLKLRTEVLDQVASEVKGTAPGFVERLQEKYDQTQRFAADVDARDVKIRELERLHGEETRLLESARRKADFANERLTKQMDELEKQVASLQKTKDELIAKYVPPPKTTDPATGGDEKTAAGDRSIWWYVGGGILAAVILVAGVWWSSMLLSEKHENGDDQPITKDNEEKPGNRREPIADSAPSTLIPDPRPPTPGP